MKIAILAAAAVSFAVTGCATDATTSSEPRAEKEYQTGSNIARKKTDPATGLTTVDREELERARNAGNAPIRAGKGN
jgi:hypothetical protein